MSEPNTAERTAPPWGVRLAQRQWWWPKDRPKVRVSDMDKFWRYNTCKWLERRAARIGLATVWWMVTIGSGPLGPSGHMACDAFDREVEELDRAVTSDLVGWMRGQPLYRSLARTLPTRSGRLWRIQRGASHWSGCPARQVPSALCLCP